MQSDCLSVRLADFKGMVQNSLLVKSLIFLVLLLSSMHIFEVLLRYVPITTKLSIQCGFHKGYLYI